MVVMDDEPAASASRSPSRWHLWTSGTLAILTLAGFAWSIHELNRGFADRFAGLRRDMSAEEVRARLGEPTRVLEAMELEDPDHLLLHEKFGVGYEWWVYDRPATEVGSIARYVVLLDNSRVARWEYVRAAAD